MRALVITREGLELAKASLTHPTLVIGRSPACDVVLRAPGIHPVHLLLEWLGEGDFDPHSGLWSVFELAPGTKIEGLSIEESSGPKSGVVLGTQPVHIGGVTLSLTVDSLAATSLDGGHIRQHFEKVLVEDGSIDREPSFAPTILEVITINRDTDSVTDVQHVFAKRKSWTAVRAAPQVKIRWTQKVGSELSWSGGAHASVYIMGERLPEEARRRRRTSFSETEMVRVELPNQWVYLRRVPAVRLPRIPHEIFKDPFLRLAASVLLAGIVALFFISRIPIAERPIENKLRAAEVQIEEVTRLEPPPPPPPPRRALQPQKKAHAAAPAAAKSRLPQKNAKVNPGIQSPAPVKNVNSVGLLGTLRRSQGKAATIRADQVVNSGIVTDAVTGEGGAILVPQTPGGVVDLNQTRQARTGENANLNAASTTLNDRGAFDPNASGPIARKRGVKGSAGLGLGTSRNDKTSLGLGGGSGGGDGIQVAGGLTKEVVKAAVNGQHKAIRACYESALGVRSDLKGSVIFQWNISPTGLVSTVRVQHSKIASALLEGCVMSIIKKIRFPSAQNGEATNVLYPFLFQKSRG